MFALIVARTSNINTAALPFRDFSLDTLFAILATTDKTIAVDHGTLTD